VHAELENGEEDEEKGNRIVSDDLEDDALETRPRPR